MKVFFTAMALTAAVAVSAAFAQCCPGQAAAKAACKCEACGCTAAAKKADCKCDKCACGGKQAETNAPACSAKGCCAKK